MSDTICQLASESFPVTELPRRLPLRDGKPISMRAVYRWIGGGLHDGRLRTIKIGGVRHTNQRWVDEFLERASGDIP